MKRCPESPAESTIGFPSIFLVLVFTFLVRLTIVCVLPAGLNIDTDSYRRIAITLATNGTYGAGSDPASLPLRVNQPKQVSPTAYRPPLYPLLLTLSVFDGRLSPFAVGALHIGLGCCTVMLVLWLGQAWGLGRWSLFAAMLTACDPILLYQSTQIMTETLAAFMAVAALASLTQMSRIDEETQYASRNPSGTIFFRGIFAGIVLGLSCLCRPTFLPWCALVVASVFATRWKRNSVLAAIALIGGMLMAVAPWGIRNYLHFGHFKVTTTHGGYTLLLGNNPRYYRHLRQSPWGKVWRSFELDQDWGARIPSKDGEFGDDRLAYSLARQYIQAEPRMFAWACCVRIARLWNVLPQRLSDRESMGRFGLRVATALWYVVTFSLLVFAIIQLRKRLLKVPWLWGVLLCVAFTSVHVVYWSDMRMRAPLMPYLYLVAAAGLAEFVRVSK